MQQGQFGNPPPIYQQQQPNPGYPSQPPPMQQGGYYPPQPAMVNTQQSNTTVIIQQPQTAVTTVVIPQPNNYMGLSIFSCLCCFWPVGIAAIIMSCQVDDMYNSGNFEGAAATALRARNCGYLAMGLGIIIYIVIIALAV